MQWVLGLVAAVCVVASSTCAAETSATARAVTMMNAAESEKLNAIAAAAFKNVVEQFPKEKVKDEDVSITIIDMRDRDHLQMGSFRGESAHYPASVVKLFYLGATEKWLEDGKLKDTEELRRGMKEMIVNSNNDATNYILDSLTDAPSGAELPDAEMAKWLEKRQVVNRYFSSLGYGGINTSQKTWCQGPFGRDKLGLGAHSENSNRLTTNATARLLSEIVLGKAVNEARSKQMMELLHRDRKKKREGPDDQAFDFLAGALGPDDQLWSKAGWTSTARHDAAYIESGDGMKIIIVVFTTGHGRERGIIPAVGKFVLAEIRK